MKWYAVSGTRNSSEFYARLRPPTKGSSLVKAANPGLGKSFVRGSGDRSPSEVQRQASVGVCAWDVIPDPSWWCVNLQWCNRKESKTVFCQLSIMDGGFILWQKAGRGVCPTQWTRAPRSATVRISRNSKIPSWLGLGVYDSAEIR